MIKRISISESDYRAIMQWEEDGGLVFDVEYVVVPDAESAQGGSVGKKFPDQDNPTQVE
jgi:hypothetical protein